MGGIFSCKSFSAGGKTSDAFWLRKSLSVIEGTDDPPDFGKFSHSSSLCFGGSLSGASEIAGDSILPSESLSEGGNAEQTPQLVMSISYDVCIDKETPMLGNSLHCCAVILIWV